MTEMSAGNRHANKIASKPTTKSPTTTAPGLPPLAPKPNASATPAAAAAPTQRQRNNGLASKQSKGRHSNHPKSIGAPTAPPDSNHSQLPTSNAAADMPALDCSVPVALVPPLSTMNAPPPNVHVSNLGFPTYPPPGTATGSTQRPKSKKAQPAQQSTAGNLVLLNVTWDKKELFGGRPAEEMTWDDIITGPNKDGTAMTIKQIGNTPVGTGIKDPPSVAYLRQLCQRLCCGYSNPRKDPMMEKIAKIRQAASNTGLLRADIEAKKKDVDSQMCRLINVVYSDPLFERYCTLKDVLSAHELTMGVTLEKKANAFWSAVSTDYCSSEPNPVYDLLHYDTDDHEMLLGIKPYNCWALSAKACKKKWGEMRSHYQYVAFCRVVVPTDFL
jgi:hypothetical protein